MSEAPVDALRRRARTGCARAPNVRRRARTSGRWASTRRGSTDRSSALRRRGRGRCRAISTSASSPTASSEGVSAAGGLALGFNTIAVSDNQSQGTPGMRASLISREVIADSIELMVHAHDFDGLVCVVGCDKTVPAALMALARVDKPAVLVYSGPMRAGRWREREVTIQDVWEAVGAEERGLMSREDLDELERFACPGAGTCAGHFTANTMAVAIDCLGIACAGGCARAGGRARAERRGRCPRRRARRAARRARRDGTPFPRPARAPERHGRYRRDRRLDERRASPARDRPRGGRAAHAGGADGASRAARP